MTPSEQVFFNTVNYFVHELNMDIEDVIKMLVSNIDSKVARSRIRKKLMKLYIQ